MELCSRDVVTVRLSSNGGGSIRELCPAFPDNVCCTNTTDHDRECKISGFCCSVDEVFAILGCYVAYVGSCFIKDQAG